MGALLRPKSASKRILDRNAYFCEEHIHPVGRWMRRLSATASPVLMTPIKYAQGRTIKHTLGYDIHIETPMDFMRYPCGGLFLRR